MKIQTVHVRGSLRLWIPNKLPGDTDAAGLWNTLWVRRLKKLEDWGHSFSLGSLINVNTVSFQYSLHNQIFYKLVLQDWFEEYNVNDSQDGKLR